MNEAFESALKDPFDIIERATSTEPQKPSDLIRFMDRLNKGLSVEIRPICPMSELIVLIPLPEGRREFAPDEEAGGKTFEALMTPQLSH